MGEKVFRLPSSPPSCVWFTPPDEARSLIGNKFLYLFTAFGACWKAKIWDINVYIRISLIVIWVYGTVKNNEFITLPENLKASYCIGRKYEHINLYCKMLPFGFKFQRRRFPRPMFLLSNANVVYWVAEQMFEWTSEMLKIFDAIY